VKTYSINTMGGVFGRGIPSRDVAIAMAADLIRYTYFDDSDDIREWGLRRQDVRVDEVEYEDDVLAEVSSWTYTHLTTQSEHRGVAVHEERRCDHCGGRPRWSLSE
jgi:hypothetical protein